MLFRSVIDEIDVSHLLKRVPCQQRIGPGLVTFPDRPIHIQGPSDSVQPTVQVVAESHHMFQIFGKPYRVDPSPPILVEIDPLPSQELDGIRRVRVTLHVEVAEVEFPDESSSVGGSEVGQVAGRIGRVRPTWIRFKASTLDFKVL
ncbi:hypothetical protein F3Y22_tig00018093pilonHSYRG00026 [Hibiscus syriacus]|uniref:Uncharacterized protein n=1 Tax=Hibiscus syriacus TaxID=106335 RepID=A0A6A3C0X7_HIBSY|nr:hypothetical protein F3Y22_tig00018093pilonHSYRG00026 [Hibiscus syriacus]